jgi:hypothetical protein
VGNPEGAEVLTEDEGDAVLVSAVVSMVLVLSSAAFVQPVMKPRKATRTRRRIRIFFTVLVGKNTARINRCRLFRHRYTGRYAPRGRSSETGVR